MSRKILNPKFRPNLLNIMETYMIGIYRDFNCLVLQTMNPSILHQADSLEVNNIRYHSRTR